MKESDDSILYKTLLTSIFINFLPPCLSIYWDLLRIHLLDFVAQIMLKDRISEILIRGRVACFVDSGTESKP